MTIYQLNDKQPTLAAGTWVAPGAHVIGQVALGPQCSIWFGAVLRGDNEQITLGANSNVQEGAVLHTDPGYPMVVGESVTIGHQAMLHGCKVGDGSMIGIQAVVLNGAVIGRDSLVGAGALVTEGKVFPDRALILGSPAKVARTLSDDEVAKLKLSAQAYVDKALMYGRDLQVLDQR